MKKHFAITFSLLLALTSCNETRKPGADGYVFGDKQFERQSVQVNTVVYKSESEFASELRKRRLPETVAAFTILQPPFDSCTIHMIDPAIRYEPEFVGHEFLHCSYGQWHTNNESRK